MLGAVMYRNTMLRRGCTLSPREEFNGVKFDVKLHARAKFMQYFLGYRRPNKSNGTRSERLSVYLCSIPAMPLAR